MVPLESCPLQRSTQAADTRAQGPRSPDVRLRLCVLYVYTSHSTPRSLNHAKSTLARKQSLNPAIPCRTEILPTPGAKMNSIAAMADEKPQEIKRKPVAAPNQAYVPSKEIAVETKEYPLRHDTVSTIDTLPPRPTSHHHRRPALTSSRLVTKWSLLSKRMRIGIIAGILILLAFIIGLSVGLSKKSRTSNLPLPTNHGGPYTGELTYYDPALGACGLTNSGSDSICAVSHIVFDAVSVGSNPNANPLCGKKIRARRNGKSVDLTVVDRCTGCKATDIDTTRAVFADVASIDQGRVDVEWSWLEDVPGGTMGS